jgi:hypothetical protein
LDASNPDDPRKEGPNPGEAVPSEVPDEVAREESAPTLEAIRARHPSSGRSRTIPNVKKLSTQEQKQRWREDNEYSPRGPRPKERGECGTMRPCPWVGCSAHLYLDVDPESGALKLNFPDKEPWEMTFSCALDEADAAGDEGMTLEQVAERTQLTRERIRQLESRTLEDLRGSIGQDGPIPLRRRSTRLRVILGP